MMPDNHLGKQMRITGNWKLEKGDKTYIKVVDFPDENGAPAESMWVILVSGDDNEGIGRLDNDPIIFNHPRGTLVKFGGGTNNFKPSFIEVTGHTE